jgi:hypothetical protein
MKPRIDFARVFPKARVADQQLRALPGHAQQECARRSNGPKP